MLKGQQILSSKNVTDHLGFVLRPPGWGLVGNCCSHVVAKHSDLCKALLVLAMLVSIE